MELRNLAQIADRLTGSAIPRKIINAQIERYGKMNSLKIDSGRKLIEAEVLLLGETQPITLKISDYNISDGENAVEVTLGDVTVSREWMNVLAKQLLIGRKFQVPSRIGKWIHLII